MKYSVIIPLYNKGPYIEKTIKSVLAQTFNEFELIVVDDGSNDNSFDIASVVLQDCDNCRLIKQENAGASAARNNGAAVSNGDYLCFLDADDWWESTFLEEMLRLIEAYPDAGIYGVNYTIVNETKGKTRVANIGVESDFKQGYINYCQVYAKTMYMPLCNGTICIPREVFHGVGGYPEGITLGEDFLLWIKIALNYKVAFLNKPLAYYNQDVEFANRGVGKLHDPKCHMLWNLGSLGQKEETDPDFKRLVDNLRTDGLLLYFLSKEYHEVAKKELDKVEWKEQDKKVRIQYEGPLFWLRAQFILRLFWSNCKKKLIGFEKKDK